MMRRACRLLSCLLMPLLLSTAAQATTLISQTFATNPTWNTGTGWFRGGTTNPTVTGAWLRLTPNSGDQQGYAYYNTAFNVNQGFTIDFEFASWGGNGADGMIMFLFDGSVTSANFRSGAAGGSLSYANDCAATGTGDAGMSKAYVGIAFDEFGNFSNPADRCKNGGPGAVADSVSIRGPGDWDGTGTLPSTAYSYLTGATAPANLDCTACTTRPDTGTNWRRARITMLKSGSAWTVSVDVQFGTTAAFTRLIDTYPLTAAPPSTLKIGFAASTGGSYNYHDIRNVTVSNPVDITISKTAPADVMVSSAFNYVLTVANAYTDPAGSVVVTDSMPTGITYTTAVGITGGAGTCTLATGTPRVLTCNIGTMTAGETRTITVAATSAGTTQRSVTNTATVSQVDIDINPNNNTSAVSTNIWAAPAVTIVKSATNVGGTVITNGNPGSEIAYIIQATNTGGAAKSYVMTDAMSPFTALNLNTYGTGVPFQFNAGSSGLSMPAGSIEYSSNNGSTWTYTPVSGGGGAPAGYDGAVTNFRISLTGTMGVIAGGTTSWTLNYRSRIE